ncbi:MAG: toxin [Candidatus Omnitrophica bacterium]|nr:toxin [Candidatus Omnitrophota bacterium]MDE2008493.1 toxin [Candidatus Omnitrophota bacterium]MDE2215195.1 toxin [Candidatus Omnitrophota bacterium]MDE2231386.1 toxin [Candidatus Omnitrophota bacterium]
MKEILWDPLKNERLKKARGVSFEELTGGKLIDIKDHPGRNNQKLMLIDYKGYIWLVPFVETEKARFLKTLYPSRRYTKLYREGKII